MLKLRRTFSLREVLLFAALSVAFLCAASPFAAFINRGSGLRNIHALALAEKIYENDYDDGFPLANLLNPGRGAFVAWVDMHVSIQSAGQLTAGTDFATSTDEDPAGISKLGKMGCVVTDVRKYLWSLDGTLKEAKGLTQQ
jgi:hypothetical protein